MASGHANRANRPNTWPQPTASADIVRGPAGDGGDTGRYSAGAPTTADVSKSEPSGSALPKPANLYRRCAPGLVALSPGVLLPEGGSIAGALREATRTILMVIVGTTDPGWSEPEDADFVRTFAAWHWCVESTRER